MIALAHIASCATFSPALADLKSVPDVAVRSLVASPACPETAQMLAAFHQGALRGCDCHITHACFVADRKTATTPTSITITQSMTQTCPRIAPADYAEFRARALDVVTHENDPLVLSK